MKKEELLDEESLIEECELAFYSALQRAYDQYPYRWERINQAKEEIVAIIKNQPTITEKNIKEWAYEAQYRVETYKDWGYVADAMKEMLTEIGVPIIKSGK